MYGACASCACFHEHLAAKLLALGFNPSKADPDLWYRDKGDHYEYITTYIDDLLIASRNLESIIQAMEECYILNGVGVLSYYLGGDVIQGHTLDAWKLEPIDWILASKTYATNIIETFERLMAEGRALYHFSEYKTPMDKEYHPELDETAFLDAEFQTRYRSMIGSLNWLISL